MMNKNNSIEPDVIFKNEDNFYISNPVDAKGKALVIKGNLVKRIYMKNPDLSDIRDLSISNIGEGHIETVLELLVRTSTPVLSMEDALRLRLDCVVLAAGGFKQFCMACMPEDLS